MHLRITGTGLILAILTMAPSPTFAQSSAATGAVAPVTKPKPAVIPASPPSPSFLPADFNVPTLVETARFKIVPLGPELVKVDFDAYMSSIEHLQKTFTRSPNWPHKGISDADAMRDMETEQARFKNRESFAYAVLTADGRRERGCVYVYPSTVKGYDAIVRMWVTKAEYDAGFDAELYRWVTNWIQTDWHFKNVAYPGRSIEWGAWDSMVAANKAAKAGPEEQNY